MYYFCTFLYTFDRNSFRVPQIFCCGVFFNFLPANRKQNGIMTIVPIFANLGASSSSSSSISVHPCARRAPRPAAWTFRTPHSTFDIGIVPIFANFLLTLPDHCLPRTTTRTRTSRCAQITAIKHLPRASIGAALSQLRGNAIIHYLCG
jgi:hypothetical protein